jgi:hypothetical protein
MAAYQPPTEILPKFNEFVFNQANSPEYLDQLVVHKAGTETITGQKTFKNDIFLVENSAGADKISVNGTTTTIANTSIKLQAIAGTDVLSIASGQVSSNQNISISKTLPTSTAPVMSISNGYLNSQQPNLLLRFFSSFLGGYGANIYPTRITKSQYDTFGTQTETDVMSWNASTGDIELSALNATNDGNLNLVAGTALQNNSQTFNPRRQYQLDYTNGSTSSYYGLEIVRAANDPNNPFSPTATNGKTYIEIFSNGNPDAGYNSSRLNGYFIGSGNSDAVNQSDFLCSTYDYLNPTFGLIMTGSTAASYTNIVFYLIGGFQYTIITDGKVGQYWNNANPGSERWTPSNTTTYNTGATTTFAIKKNNNLTDNTGTTAVAATLSAPVNFLDTNIWEYTTNRRNKFKITDSKIIAPEQYIAAAGATTAVPVVSFTKSGVRVGGTSFSTLSWGIDPNAITQRARIPFKCRCVGVDISFDTDATPPTVSTRFIATLGSTTAVGSSDYLYTEIFVGSGGWTASGNAVSEQITQTPTIPANTDFYGSWQLFNFSTGVPVSLNQEFLITFYFQQLP